MLLITGASGYIGRALVTELLDRGQTLRLASRRPSTENLSWYPLRLEAINETPNEAFFDVTCVIHCAGLAHRSAPYNQYDQLNIQATLKLIRRASLAGAHHFILVSTMNVVPSWAVDSNLDIRDYPVPDEPYAASKWHAELKVSEYCDREKIKLSVIRPALVYDRELKPNLAALARILRWWPFALPKKGKRCLVARSDLVKLITNVAVSTPQHSKQILAATDGEIYDLFRIGNALIKGRKVMPMPENAYRFASYFRDIKCWKGGELDWKSLTEDHWCARASEIRGWKPVLTLESCMMSENLS